MYPHVYVQDDGEWCRIAPSQEDHPQPSPPPGIEDRTRVIGETLGAAGWVATASPDNVVLRMLLTGASGTRLRLDQVVGVFSGIEDALVLVVEFPDGLAHPYGDAPTIVLDVFDLASGRGGRDRLPAVLDVITARQHTIDVRSLSHVVQALQLCCPVYLVRDGELGTISYNMPTFGGEPSSPLPRSLAEMERVVAGPRGDTAAAWLERGLAANAVGRPDLAVESFDAAIARDPNDALAHFHRADAIGTGDMCEAGRGYLRCVELGFAIGPALLHYATVLRQCGHREQVAETLRDLLARLPEYGRGWYERALTAVKDGRLDESIEAATRAVRLTPEHGEAFYTRACAYALRGQTEQALADIHRAIEVDSSLRPQIREDEDFVALRDDPRFTELTDSWPEPDPDDKDSMRPSLIAVLRPAGWRPNDLAISIGRISSLEYPCQAGRLIVGLSHGDEYYFNFRPYGNGEDGEAWLYLELGGNARVFGEFLTAWQDRLTAENFPEFAQQAQHHFPETSWHWGHP